MKPWWKQPIEKWPLWVQVTIVAVSTVAFFAWFVLDVLL